MVICPKCNLSNDEQYSFCVECGTPLPHIPDASSEAPTIDMSLDKSVETVLIPPDKLPETVMMPPDNTVQMPPDELLKTQYSPPPDSVENQAPPTVQMPPENVPPTQYYSPANTNENEMPPTVMMPPNEIPPTVQHSSQNLSAAQQFVPSESVETAVNPQFVLENEETKADTKQKSKKSKMIFLIGGISLLVLLLGGVATAYFLHEPGQKSRSYLLTDKHDADKALEFDGQNSKFLMGDIEKSPSQKWQITPDPDDKDYYRFVNRGLGENESLEVIDNEQDSSVTMAQSLNDIGQLWAITNVEGDYYRITNKWLGDNKSLSHKKRYYYFLRIKDSSDKEGQLWKKIPAGNGSFYFTNKQYGDAVSLRAIDEGDYKDKLVMKSDDYGIRQWNLTDAGNGYYSLNALGSSKSLDVNPNKKDRVMMAASDSSGGQKWKMTPVGNDYFRLTNESLGNGKSLEAVTFSRYYVEMVKSSDDPGQLWKLPRTDK